VSGSGLARLPVPRGAAKAAVGEHAEEAVASAAHVASADATLAAVRLVWTSYFLTFDFLILPAVHSGALTKADCTLPQRSRLLSLTAPASLGGLPVLTIPVPLESGLTAGLQIVVNHPQSPVLPWTLEQF
jgi:amidase/aspartyl-tRNA(Asn)/glutamyl-tRNA(Gln) amidotransferase subunit A